jgi:hypothetical protein
MEMSDARGEDRETIFKDSCMIGTDLMVNPGADDDVAVMSNMSMVLMVLRHKTDIV